MAIRRHGKGSRKGGQFKAADAPDVVHDPGGPMTLAADAPEAPALEPEPPEPWKTPRGRELRVKLAMARAGTVAGTAGLVAGTVNTIGQLGTNAVAAGQVAASNFPVFNLPQPGAVVVFGAFAAIVGAVGSHFTRETQEDEGVAKPPRWQRRLAAREAAERSDLG